RELSERLQEENSLLKEEINLNYNFNNIISQSKAYKKILQQVEQVAGTDATVLIVGETGTGKELLARATHKLSKRDDYPLIKVNCAGLPKDLIESELFGHEKGAFTGAYQQKKGRFELAHRGTIFLDEIGEMPLSLQSKLLRVLQEGEFERVGGNKTIRVDARVIAATNRKLEQMVDEGQFREDLFYRLNVFPISNIPLR
ncbi:MAG: sigma-54 factor interaction domain-containing protein, partial [Acidobacteria bacterium]|nr:sigma-54 factor interaction domain-containing protein [Acidobacteriota bacterium]